MKITSFLFKARGAFLALMGGVVLLSSLDANAIPVFARQTGFKCVACHVGGEYPQLTALGRYFKLTGYTQGDAKNIFGEMTTNLDRSPFAVWLQSSKQWYANSQTAVKQSNPQVGGTNGQGGINGVAPTSAFDAQTISLFTGGHFTDNVGGFIQWTAAKYDALTTSTGRAWTVALDNSEVRAADHLVNSSGDWIYGAYINNRITMSDVWNTQENWTSDWIGYFNGGLNGTTGLAPSTFLQSGLSQHNLAGLGFYLYKDKTWYGEVALYKGATSGPLTVMTEGTDANTAPLVDHAFYARFGYNKEWGPHEVFVGLHGLYGSGHLLASPYDNTGAYLTPANYGVAYYDNSLPISTYQDTGIDAQYQYILDPHYFAAHFRFTHETMENSSLALSGVNFAGQTNSTGALAGNPVNSLNEYWVDFTYIYKAKYGAMLFFHGARGNNDTTLYSSGVNGSPDWDSIMPSIFWSPYQNIRVGVMETFYTRLGGTTSTLIQNVNGLANNLSPHAFNTTMLYGSIIY